LNPARLTGEPIEGVFELATAVVHNEAIITGSEPLTVVTDSPQWSYAVGFRLRSETLKSRPGEGPILVRVQATVESGRIGVIFVGDDVRTVLGTSTEHFQDNGETVLDVLIDPAPASGWLILRNLAPGTPSRCQVRSIQAFRTNKRLARGPSDLTAVLSPDTGAIDLDRLATAAIQARAKARFGNTVVDPLRQNWSDLPAGLIDRRRTTDLMEVPDEELPRTPIRAGATTGKLDVVPVEELARRMGFAEALDYPDGSRHKPLSDWKMEVDDSPIFRYLYRNSLPRRHLEFGTWQGTGTLYCLEECAATVWTLNLAEGEVSEDGTHAYESDSGALIGQFYRQRGFGHRVCQIYCDSRDWDISHYPQDFFDSALIDGGHNPDVVASDTTKALRLLREGGVCMWHDFCPDPEVLERSPASLGVVEAVLTNWTTIRSRMQDIFWIEPSHILLGVVGERPE
jgi:methyltransferase family protein